jgi:hypothetical protein
MKRNRLSMQAFRLVWLLFALVFLIAFLLNATALPGYAATICAPEEECEWYRLTVDAARSLAAAGMALSTYGIVTAVPILFTAVVFWAVGGLLFVRRSDQGFGLLVSYLLIGFGAAGPSWALVWANPDIPPPILSLAGLGSAPTFIILQIVLLTFPNGRFQPRRSWLLIGLMVLNNFFWMVDDPRVNIGSWQPGLLEVWLLVVFGAPILIQIYRYFRLYNHMERLQTRWFIGGLIGGLLPGTVLRLVILGLPDTLEVQVLRILLNAWLVSLFYLPISIAIGIAVLRYRLWDIDIIIRRTLIYTVLTGILAAVYFGGIILTQQVFRAATGESSDLAIVVSTLLIAALFTPVRRRVQDGIDRRLYRRKYDVEQTLADFQKNLREDVDMETLKANLVGVVNDTMQPSSVRLWVAPTDSPRGATPL